MRTEPHSSWTLKYGVEWVCALVGLGFCIVPLVVIALLVKATSPGPVFYVSERLGQNGRLFRLYKFRSMRVGSPAILGSDGKVLTLKQDSRFTPIGRVLRLGFDELPQLLNIIKNDMCLIGPRPDIPSEYTRYTERQKKRLMARPGITGLAQVVGGRYMDNAQNYELDVQYVEHRTWFMDLLILLVTLPYSLGMESIGARLFPKYIACVRSLDASGNTNAARS